MSKFKSLLKEALNTVNEQTPDEVAGDPAAIPPPALGPVTDNDNIQPDDKSVTDEERLGLIQLCKDCLFKNPAELRSTGAFDLLLGVLQQETNSGNADEQLAALKQITRDHPSDDTGLKSAGDGDANR